VRILTLIIARFPSSRDLRQAFLVSVFPVAIWSWLIFAYNLPSFLRSLRVGQIISIFAYMQVMFLIESFLLFLLVTLLAALLPRRLFLNNYVPQATLLVLILAFWAIGIHLHGEQAALGNVASGPIFLYYWTSAWLVIFLTLSIIARLKSRFNSLLLSFIGRLTFVSSIYLFFAVISLPIVVLRNIVPA